ncbi:MAG: hypothetical protein J6C37_05850 [Roseburia sp.]|nr:hypothetical protein [Roseburia sp.]
MEYIIMRKDEPITLAQFSEDGTMLKYSRNIQNIELAPLQEKSASDWLNKWWKERTIPIKQGKVAQMLQKKGLSCPEHYLIKNLGLSLTDYYWIKPIDSDLKWKDVNLFENDFRDNILSFPENDTNTRYPQYTPNSSLQGRLEKSWMIKDEKRILVKGNHDKYSSESINEVIAARIHELQGYDNYTKYGLVRIKNKYYDYGCYSEMFTSQKLELVSAYGVVTSEKQPNDMSSYEFFIHTCGRHGIDPGQLRRDLEYQIMTDFIMSDRDRHLGNVSILRDAETLQFLRMAPIYDSGESLFVHEGIPVSDKELLDIETNSFASTEVKLLRYVTDKSLVDVTKLPDKKYIMEMYGKDSQMEEKRIHMIGEWYERKIDYFRDFQLGKDLNQVKISLSRKMNQRHQGMGEEEFEV